MKYYKKVRVLIGYVATGPPRIIFEEVNKQPTLSQHCFDVYNLEDEENSFSGTTLRVL